MPFLRDDSSGVSHCISISITPSHEVLAGNAKPVPARVGAGLAGRVAEAGRDERASGGSGSALISPLNHHLHGTNEDPSLVLLARSELAC
jgi:hypothetical protein